MMKVRDLLLVCVGLAVVLLAGCEDEASDALAGTTQLQAEDVAVLESELAETRSELERALRKLSVAEHKERQLELNMGMTDAALIHVQTTSAVAAVRNLALVGRSLEVPDESRDLVLGLISMAEIQRRKANDLLAMAESDPDFDPKRLGMIQAQLEMIEENWQDVKKLQNSLEERK